MCIVAAPRASDSGDDQPSAGTLLREAFLRDHQLLTRGFRDLLVALERHDDDAAREIADRLDRVAGAHIEFEEGHYYPALRECLGRDRVEEMYDEHQVGLSAIRAVVSRPESTALAPEERSRVMHDAQVALDHAVACGAALAHLEGLDEASQRRLLDALLAAHESGRRWSELEPPAARNG
jgi:hypothetical protein